MYYVVCEEEEIYSITTDYMEACDKVEQMLDYFTSDIEYMDYIEELSYEELLEKYNKEELKDFVDIY